MKQAARILVVDDDSESRSAIELVLNAGDFDQVTLTDSADGAFALLDLENDDELVPPVFDVVLLDVMMPGADGIEACARIRNTRRYRDTPILIVSGLRETEALNQAFLAGAHDYITKPLNRMELLARVRSAMRLKRELDRRRAREADLRNSNRELRLTTAPDYFDTNTLLPSRAAFQFLVQNAADTDRAFGMLAFLIHDFALYRTAQGDAAAQALCRKIAIAVSRVEAPLNWTLCSYEDGLLMVLAPEATEAVLNHMADQVRERVISMQIQHGNSAEGDHVRLRVAAGRGRGAELLALPAGLIRAVEHVGAGGGTQFGVLEAEA